MSETPSENQQNHSPFVQTTTPAIERANRLMGLRAHPGFVDLIRISQELVQEQADNCAGYPGWDAQQIVVLKVRMQCAKEHHAMLLGKINEAIMDGIAEQRVAPNLSDKSTAEVLDQSDLVRQEVLTRFSDMDAETRVPGSY
jgi:hypothetical protein